MDPVTAALIVEGMKIGIALWASYQREQGKTEEEISAMLGVEVDKALKFDPNSIKDV